jgi:hypothetical protein
MGTWWELGGSLVRVGAVAKGHLLTNIIYAIEKTALDSIARTIASLYPTSFRWSMPLFGIIPIAARQKDK